MRFLFGAKQVLLGPVPPFPLAPSLVGKTGLQDVAHLEVAVYAGCEHHEHSQEHRGKDHDWEWDSLYRRETQVHGYESCTVACREHGREDQQQQSSENATATNQTGCDVSRA